MSETETVGPCLVQKLKWGGGGRGMAPLLPPVATPLLMLSLSVNSSSLTKVGHF